MTDKQHCVNVETVSNQQLARTKLDTVPTRQQQRHMTGRE